MKTIELKEFTDCFMAISNNLTHAELRMLYLLITEPDVIKLSRQKFAEKIGTHRRTIWLGIEKLKKLNYISAIKTTDDQMTVDSDKNITKTQLVDSDTNITDNKVIIESDKNITDKPIGKGDKIIALTEEEKAIKFILQVMKQEYPDDNKNILVDEDIYRLILGAVELPAEYKFDRKLITKTIKDNYPECRFHWQKDKTPLSPEERNTIVLFIDEEIRAAKKNRKSQLDKNRLVRDIRLSTDISNEKILKVIQEDFPNLVIFGNIIKISKV